MAVAEAKAYDPLKASLPLAAQWDGVPRARQLFFRYYGATASPLLEALSEKFLIQLVARALDPAQFDKKTGKPKPATQPQPGRGGTE